MKLNIFYNNVKKLICFLISIFLSLGMKRDKPQSIDLYIILDFFFFITFYSETYFMKKNEFLYE